MLDSLASHLGFAFDNLAKFGLTDGFDAGWRCNQRRVHHVFNVALGHTGLLGNPIGAFVHVGANEVHDLTAGFALVFRRFSYAKGFAKRFVSCGNDLLLRCGCLFGRLANRTGASIGDGASNARNDTTKGCVCQAGGCAALATEKFANLTGHLAGRALGLGRFGVLECVGHRAVNVLFANAWETACGCG